MSAPMETINRRGLMLVLSSPSGAGKTTIARRVLGQDLGITASISHTTRERRPGEVDGKDYHFVDKQTFTQMRDEPAIGPIPLCIRSSKEIFVQFPCSIRPVFQFSIHFFKG